MRTLIDIPEDDLKALDRLGERGGVSRAKLVRRAIRDYLDKTTQSRGDTAFGLWNALAEDGLDYQHRVRSEW